MLNSAAEAAGQLKSVLNNLGKVTQGLDVLLSLGEAASEVRHILRGRPDIMRAHIKMFKLHPIAKVIVGAVKFIYEVSSYILF